MRQKADYKKAKEQALKLLHDEYGYTKPPIDPFELATLMGIRVYLVNFSEEDNDISGLFNLAENSIYVAREEPANRQNFTVAHEIGHKILHETWLKENGGDILHREQLTTSTDIKEQEANCFAANLLVPKFMLDKYKDYASIYELSTLFGVSEYVIRIRLKNEYNY